MIAMPPIAHWNRRRGGSMEAAALEASRGADPCRPPERHSGRHSLTPDSERYRQFQGRALAGPAPSCGSGTPGAATRGQAACAGPSAHQGAGHRASLIAPRIAVALPRLRAAAQRRAARRNHCGAAPIARDIRPPLCMQIPCRPSTGRAASAAVRRIAARVHQHPVSSVQSRHMPRPMAHLHRQFGWTRRAARVSELQASCLARAMCDCCRRRSGS